MNKLKAQAQQFVFESQAMDLSRFGSLDGITAQLERTRDESPLTIGKQEFVSISPAQQAVNEVTCFQAVPCCFPANDKSGTEAWEQG